MFRKLRRDSMRAGGSTKVGPSRLLARSRKQPRLATIPFAARSTQAAASATGRSQRRLRCRDRSGWTARQRVANPSIQRLANPLISLARNAQRPASVSRKDGVPPAYRIRHFGIRRFINDLRADLSGRVCSQVSRSARVVRGSRLIDFSENFRSDRRKRQGALPVKDHKNGSNP